MPTLDRYLKVETCKLLLEQPNMNDYDTAQLRKFLTALLVRRAQRHLKALAILYNWSPEELAANEERFIKPGDIAFSLKLN